MTRIERAFRRSLENFAEYPDLFYTPRQLYYETCRALRQPRGVEPATAAVLFGAMSLPALSFAARRKSAAAIGLLSVGALASGGLALLRKTPHVLTAPLDYSDFLKQLQFVSENTSPTRLIETQEIETRRDEYPADLSFYGLPRLLVCERIEIAQMLRANWFQMEISCPILSLEEALPFADIFQTMLAQAENPRVYFLHDASFAAYSVIPTLRKRMALTKETNLTILGLRPAHASRMHLFAQREESARLNGDLTAITYLTDDEKRWLQTGWLAEVEALHPARLMRALKRLIMDLPVSPNYFSFALPKRSLGFMS